MPLPSWIGQTIGGRYKIESLLGQGGMSAVYRAADPNLRRAVAIKLIHTHLAADPEFVRRFEEEAAAVAQLRHPNIIQVYDFNHDGDTYYMVLEYVAGETLQSRLKALSAAGEHLAYKEIVRLMTTVGEAVHYAHGRGMIHRDLKPANVMLSAADQPILMDFGVAKIMGGQHHTATGAVIGTPTYIAPEIIRGERPDERADIYSLGVMLFEMTVGRPPFEADSAITLMMKHVNDPVPDIRALKRDVPEDLVRVIEKSLAKQPGGRFQTAHDLAATLRAVNMQPRPVVPAAAVETPRTPTPTRPPMAKTVVDSAPPASAAPPAKKMPPAAHAPKRRLTPILIGCGALALVGLAAIGLGAFGASQLIGGTRATDTSSTVGQATAAPPTAAAHTAAAIQPTDAARPTDTPPPTEVVLPEPPPGMALVPPGFFSMGSSDGQANERPEHPVLLDAFYIDEHEVTNAGYRQCVNAGGCAPSLSGRVNNPAFDNYPVVGVNWSQANAYCRWADKRLPTEAEWEFAASGQDNRKWPWGDHFDANLSAASAPDVRPVGSYPDGASPFGILDMAGNVNEWVADSFDAAFYSSSPPVNPFNKADSGTRIYRGGSFGNTDSSFYTTSRRFPKSRVFSDVDIGFRCAKDAPEANQSLPAEKRRALIDRFCAAYLAYKPGASCP